MPLSDSFIQELKYRNDITDVVSGYVNLKKRGRNMIGLCPFHGEKTPSFNLYPDNGSFYCFGCGVGGDVITFIRQIENLDYIEAVKFLAQRAGLDMPQDTSADDGISKLKGRIYEANREAARFFYRNLFTAEGSKARKYLYDRGLTEKTVKHFGLGYSPSSRFALVNYMTKKGYSKEDLIHANLAFSSRSGNIVDRFCDRVMFPIIDLRGNVIAFGGRIMGDGKPKYLNTSDTLVFKKSSNLFAFNFAKASSQSQIILAEGYMDVIALHQAGFTNSVATLGTALTEEQAKLMSRYAKEIIISYDSDEAGQKAASRAINILRGAGLLIRVLTIPKGKDPDEFIRSYGEQGPIRFKQLLEASGNDVEYKLQKIKRGCNIQTSDGKIEYITQATKVLSELGNKIEREIYAGKISEETGVERSSILLQVDRLISRKKRNNNVKQFREIQQEISARKDVINPEKKNNLRAAIAEEALIAYVINNPDEAETVAKRLKPDDFITEFNKRVYKAVFTRVNLEKSIGLTEISEGFSLDEISRISKILSSYVDEQSGEEVRDEYIEIILQENEKKRLDKLESTSVDDIKKYIEKLRELKK